MIAQLLCVARSTNEKTGDVPTAWIGGTREESIGTCAAVKCPLLHRKYGGKGGKGAATCYAQHGNPAFAHATMCKSNAKGKDYSPETAIAERSASARMVRIGAIGDPAVADRAQLARFVELAKRAGLSVVGYTHGWRRRFARDLKGVVMASCDSMADVDKAIADGWRAAVVLPGDHTDRTFVTPAGHRGIVCPAIQAKRAGKSVTCNDCRLCDASRPGPVIGFPDHGPGSVARQGKG